MYIYLRVLYFHVGSHIRAQNVRDLFGSKNKQQLFL
jgi:hypothetical protein